VAIGQMPGAALHGHPVRAGEPAALAVLRATEGPANRPPAAVRRLVCWGSWATTCYQLFFILGLAHTSVTNSSLILATVPTVVAVFAGLLGLERITPRMWGGIALGTLGVPS